MLGVVPKTYLPNYNEFYEKRWFASSVDAVEGFIEIDGKKVPFGNDLLFKCGDVVLAAELCEDVWTPVPPSCASALAGANVIVNLSASNEVTGKHAYLCDLIKQQSARCIAAYIYSIGRKWRIFYRFGICRKRDDCGKRDYARSWK